MGDSAERVSNTQATYPDIQVSVLISSHCLELRHPFSIFAKQKGAAKLRLLSVVGWEVYRRKRRNKSEAATRPKRTNEFFFRVKII
jgi:hypothetical protein